MLDKQCLSPKTPCCKDRWVGTCRNRGSRDRPERRVLSLVLQMIVQLGNLLKMKMCEFYGLYIIPQKSH